MNSANQTSVAAAQPEITAPVRLEGQSNSEVLFTWLLVNRYLWMLDTEHDAELECIVGERARLRLGFKLIEWRRRQPNSGEGHAALVAPKDDGARQKAFARLERLIEVHLLDGDSSGPPQDGSKPEGLNCDA